MPYALLFIATALALFAAIITGEKRVRAEKEERRLRRSERRKGGEEEETEERRARRQSEKREV
jgi:hypothetical protein